MHITVLVRSVVVVIVVACCSFLLLQQALMLDLLLLTFANCTFGGSDSDYYLQVTPRCSCTTDLT